MRTRIRSERGIALAVAIFALVVVGGLVSAAFFVAVQEQRIGRNTVNLQKAFAAADGGVDQIVNDWNTDTYNTITAGTTINIGRTAMPNNSGWYRGSVRRLNDYLFLVQTEGFSWDSTARQALGVLIRLKTLEIVVNSALRTQGVLKIGGSSFLSGQDALPTGWTGCPATSPTLPGIRLPPADSAKISYSGCDNQACIQGDPKIQTDAAVSDSTLSHFGDLAFADLKAMATKILAGGTYSNVEPPASGCDKTLPKNWGDPTNPLGACGNYFPIVWIDGDAIINGTKGQGVLIVNGDLSVQGGFEFFGPVIVKGSMKTAGTGGHFNGGVIARNVDLEQETLLGDAVINFSSCALMRALTASAQGAQVRERGWMNLY